MSYSKIIRKYQYPVAYKKFQIQKCDLFKTNAISKVCCGIYVSNQKCLLDLPISKACYKDPCCSIGLKTDFWCLNNKKGIMFKTIL